MSGAIAAIGPVSVRIDMKRQEKIEMATRKTSAMAATVTKTATSKPIEAAIDASKETVETVEEIVKAGSQAASVGYERAAALTRDQVEKTSKAVFKGYGDFASLGQDNLDAVVKSGDVVAKGFETLSKGMMDFARVSFEGNVEATNAILGAKTLSDLVDLQTKYTRRNLDQFLAESTKLTELTVKVANEAFAPIKARVDVAVEKMVKPVAF